MTEEAQAETAPPTLPQKIAAEAFGTFVLVLIGCGVAVLTQADVVATALAFGIAIVMMAYAFGRVSGGHFNPAVSLGAALSGRLSWKEFGIYAGVQIGAALVAAGVLRVLLIGFEDYDIDTWGIGANGFGDQTANDYAWWAAFLLELLLTFLFVMVILSVTDERNRAVASMAPLAIGLSLAAIHLFAIPATGTSVNPARSIGPGIISFDGDTILQLWLFILAPFIGGALAGFLTPLIFGRDKEPIPGSGLSVGSGGSSNPGFTQQWAQQPGQGGQPGQHAQMGGGQMGGQHAQEQPIIQDGWQWDPAAQQWIPAQQQAPQPGGWAPPGGDDGGHTQVRPPQ